LLGEAEFKAVPYEGWTLTARPYLRYDRYDRRRDLIDLPEAKLAYARGPVRARLGFETETWGVMEYVNTTDVLNQNDILDGFLSKRKLGQPMAAASWITGAGTLDAYALAFLRPMPFPGPKGRLRPGLRIARSPDYGSDAGRFHPEGALRYSGHAGPLDLSASWFHGYEREPRFALGLDADGPLLVPEYRLSHQVGGDAVWVAGDWILKTEDAVRLYEDGGRTRYAYTLGVERGIASPFGLPWDLSLYAEYLRDTRDPSLVLPFTDDLFTGLRIACNDRHATEAVLSYVQDTGAGESAVLLGEASLRLFDRLKLTLTGSWLIRPELASPLAPLRQDSHARARAYFYF
jgi:hypothetical protein